MVDLLTDLLIYIGIGITRIPSVGSQVPSPHRALCEALHGAG